MNKPEVGLTIPNVSPASPAVWPSISTAGRFKSALPADSPRCAHAPSTAPGVSRGWRFLLHPAQDAGGITPAHRPPPRIAPGNTGPLGLARSWRGRPEQLSGVTATQRLQR